MHHAFSRLAVESGALAPRSSGVVRGLSPSDEWDVWELETEVGGLALAVLRVVQDGVDVMEDILTVEKLVAIRVRSPGLEISSSA